jgi:diadenosine tetraphosphate (Ap4A) HIT family hydrolase
MERTPIHDKVDELSQGKNPYFIARLETCWVAVSDRPLIDGHCVIFADPVVFSVNDLDESTRMRYARDMCRVGDALLKVTGAYRINYETMSNVAQALHSHIYPRQLSEPDLQRRDRPSAAYKEKAFDFKSGQALIDHMKSELVPFAFKP